MPHKAVPPRDLLQDAALLLDFDGTLVELAARPELVVVDERLSALLGRLAETLGGRVAILSGRSVESILGLFGPLPLTIAGSHGLEVRWHDGTTSLPERPAALDRIRSIMTDFMHTTPGLLVEEKPFGAALHYRGAPEMQTQATALAQALANETGLHLQTGKMMVELRLGGADKGTALNQLMERAPMAGFRPVFLGDDDTDEPAMAAAAARGGAGILIGAARPSSAAYRLPDVAATLDWLETACAQAATGHSA
ncbi:trehalose-phosphatase [Sphingomonas qilianensis]|uniref:Trehalose 6-phosphate phosphatase n=1 Tax=Sphingomonas qilianensis TaxID=1736690 RepID=A0ABU9XWF7_9SPHN